MKNKTKNKKLTERQLAQQVIKKLENPLGSYTGICDVLQYVVEDMFCHDLIYKYLPKLHKYLSNRINYHYCNYDLIDRKKGISPGYFLWIPYNSKPRIAVLKKVYNIK